MKFTDAQIDEAKKDLFKVLAKVWKIKPNDKFEPYVELWQTDFMGIRIAEVGTVAKDKMSGCCFMQSDPPCAALIFACERYLVEHLIEQVEPKSHHSDDVRSAAWRISYVVEEYEKTGAEKDPKTPNIIIKDNRKTT